MKKYIVDTINKNDFTAGSKARDDIRNILTTQGFIDITISVGENKKDVFGEVKSIKEQLKSKLGVIEPNSTVVFQYPWPTMSFELAKIIKAYSAQNRYETIVVIHDINSIRTGSSVTRFYYNHYVKEIKYLDVFNHIICHNNKMKAYLVNKGIASNKIVSLHLFDYLFDKELQASENDLDFHTISVAGNLSPQKTKYIYNLVDSGFNSFNLRLFGPFYEGKTSDNIQYMGQFPASRLPAQITNGFGLVWDGNSAETCTGQFGEYLKINNPHKLSLYMACGIPAFVWSKAAVADFVRRYQVGICIDSLSDIDKIMGQLTEEDYSVMKQNAEAIRKQVTNGYYIRRVISGINKDLLK